MSSMFNELSNNHGICTITALSFSDFLRKVAAEASFYLSQCRSKMEMRNINSIYSKIYPRNVFFVLYDVFLHINNKQTLSYSFIFLFFYLLIRNQNLPIC